MVLDAISGGRRASEVADEASRQAQREFADNLNGAAAPTANNGANDQSPTGTDIADNTSQAVDAVADPAAEIAKLNSDGDQLVMSMTGEGKLQLPVPVGNVPIGIGAKGQYGYNITVEQVGDAPSAANGEAPAYEVTFDKNLLAGGVIEPPVPGIDPAAELNLRTSGSVTMRFETQAEAARAVTVLQRLAAEETMRDAGSALSPAPDLSNPASNPLTDQGGNSLQGGNPIADAIGPSAEDMDFLRGHVTSYTSAVGLQERGKVAAKFANLGIEPRLDGNQWLTRRVELPQNGEPGRVTYTMSGDLQLSTKEKLTIGKQHFDQLEIGYVPQNIVEHGRVRGEVSMSWEFPAENFESTLSGQPAPELSAAASGEIPGAPDEISASLQLDYQDQSLADLSRTDLQRFSLDATIVDPGTNAGSAINAFLSGDLEAAFRGMGEDFTVTATNETIRRDGVNQQHEVGIEFADIIEAKVSVIANIGLDDITSRRTATFTGAEIADRLWGPQASDPTSPVRTPAPATPQPGQYVVMPEEGLNVREQPSADGRKISAFQHGAFVQETGQHHTDAQGRDWMEVRGLDASDRIVQGWVNSRYLDAHAEGGMSATGRINPDLEAQGYEGHIVQTGDTIWHLAQRDGVNFQEMVQLNQDHLINPGLIFAGDTIYIPGTGRPAAPPVEPPATPPEQPQATWLTPTPPSQPNNPSAPTASPDSGSQPAPGDSSLSGQPGVQTPHTTPQAPTPPSDNSDLAAILNGHQVVEDPGGMVDWQPRGNIIRDIAGGFAGTERMTATEARMLDEMSAFELADMALIRRSAWDAAENRFPAPAERRGDFPDGAQFNAWASNDGHRDAFRHAYWNALMTSRFGSEFTERFATAHEGSPNNLADREAMDLYNNEVGRRIAIENPDASNQQLAELVVEAMDEGDLIVIDAGGKLAWSNQVAYGQHGFADDGAIAGIIQTPGLANPDSSLSANP